jgi:TonB family protein
MNGGVLVLVLWALGAQAGTMPTTDPLAAAKALYASAAYEEALSRLSTVHDTRTANEVDEYRALCLLALGRSDDAQRAIEALVTRSPLFRMSETDVSPRLVTMFHEVRRTMLPAAARTQFTAARNQFTAHDFQKAAAGFEQVLAMLDDADTAGDPARSDLRTLADGFLQLARSELARAAAEQAAADAAAATASRAAAQAEQVYSEADHGVTPPRDISRLLPEWRPPNLVAAHQQFRGVIRLVIDQAGRVETAAIVDSISEDYDRALLAAAHDWRFDPARRNGQPVKYQKLLTIVLSTGR